MAATLALLTGIGADTVVAPFTTGAMLRVAALGAIPAVDETSGRQIGLAAMFVIPADRLTPAIVVSLARAAVLFTVRYAIVAGSAIGRNGDVTLVDRADRLTSVGLVVTVQAVSAVASVAGALSTVAMVATLSAAHASVMVDTAFQAEAAAELAIDDHIAAGIVVTAVRAGERVILFVDAALQSRNLADREALAVDAADFTGSAFSVGTA